MPIHYRKNKQKITIKQTCLSISLGKSRQDFFSNHLKINIVMATSSMDFLWGGGIHRNKTTIFPSSKRQKPRLRTEILGDFGAPNHRREASRGLRSHLRSTRCMVSI
jgi:hypothetical protein